MKQGKQFYYHLWFEINKILPKDVLIKRLENKFLESLKNEKNLQKRKSHQEQHEKYKR